MNRLEFRISGVASPQVRRIQRATRLPARGVLGLSGPSLILIAPLVLLLVSELSGPPRIDIGGMTIEGREVLVLRDMSTSMDSFKAITDRALAAIRSAGTWNGVPVAIGGSASRILETIDDELVRRPGVDTVWIVSDFNDGTDLVINRDTTRYDELLRLLLSRRAKLYLSSVNTDPTPDQLQAVRATRGEWHRFE